MSENNVPEAVNTREEAGAISIIDSLHSCLNADRAGIRLNVDLFPMETQVKVNEIVARLVRPY